MSNPRVPLSRRQIEVLRMLAKRSGQRAITLPRGLQLIAISLWRRDLIEVWYRQMAGMEPALRGPFYTLTISGQALADVLLARERERMTIFPAPRGISGAEQRQ